MINISQLCYNEVKKNPNYFYTKTFTRHLKDIKELDKTRYRFNPIIANAYILFMESFQHSKGTKANTPLLLENWQKAVIGVSMGWEYLNDDNIWIRRFNTVNIFMARKNGKTILSAGLALADSVIRVQHGSEIVACATKRDQALLAWNEIHGMIKKHPDLKKSFRKVGNKLFSKLDEGTIYTLGRDSNNEDGLNISTLIVDEYHAHPNSAIKDVATSSMGARLQPLVIIISTAGFNTASPLIDELHHARNILNNNISDERYFAFVAEPKPQDKKDNPFALDTLRQSNPNIGVSVSEEFLTNVATEAKTRPDLKINYLTKYLNIFVNSAEDFLSIEDWKQCKAPDDYEDTFSYDSIKAVYIGCDLSTNDDLTALVYAYVDFEDNMYIESRIFQAEDRIIELEKKYNAPLQQWIDEGYLTTTKGSYIDYDVIYEHMTEKIKEVEDNGIDIEVYYDAYKFKGIKARLENEYGFEKAFPVNQGFLTLSEPLTMMSSYIRQHKLLHKNNPINNWCVSNVTVLRDRYGNQMIDKSSQTRKIDFVAALGNIFVGLIPRLSEEEGESDVVWI